MEKAYLIVNPGSASKKYALYQGKKQQLFAHFEKKGATGFRATIQIDRRQETASVSAAEFAQATKYLIHLLVLRKVISNKLAIKGVGLRIVAPGTYFLSNQPVSQSYLTRLEQAKEEAPLHVKPVITAIKDLKVLLPEAPIIGISDSAFHASMPEPARRYGIATADTTKLDLFRFGYHGISIQSIVRKIDHFLGRVPSRTIICHLGGGASITALKNGRSLDTSMGFTPLEGLVMGTRSGDIDAGAVIYFARKTKSGLAEVENYLNTKSGLLGLSEKTADMRELLELGKTGDNKAQLALKIYTYRIKKYLGAYTAVLNGLDLLVFSAAIGERSSLVRSSICADLENLGIRLDESKNNQLIDQDGFIQAKGARVAVAVIKTREMEEMARQTQEALRKL